jgi:glycosyltransferase involved in cell wall biosynthesis
MKNKKIVFIINNLTFLVSHRFKLVKATVSNGYDIHIICGKAHSQATERNAIKALSDENISFDRTQFSGNSKNLFTEAIGFFQITYYLIKQRPSIVHCISPKAILYGTLACRFIFIKNIVIAISGLGFAHTDSKKSYFERFLIRSYEFFLKYSLKKNGIKMIVQNMDDRHFYEERIKFPKKNITLIPGSGVDLDLYKNIDLSIKEKIILLPARLIKEKGIYEFVEASRILKKSYPEWRFCLAGSFDNTSYNSIKAFEIESWIQEGFIEYFGHVKKIHEVFIKSSIVCMPSYYREGVPKSLLEGSASGCAIVTCNTVGCRDAVKNGITGTLVEPRCLPELLEALEELINNTNKRLEFGRRGIEYAHQKFSDTSVVNAHLKIYDNFY